MFARRVPRRKRRYHLFWIILPLRQNKFNIFSTFRDFKENEIKTYDIKPVIPFDVPEKRTKNYLLIETENDL